MCSCYLGAFHMNPEKPFFPGSSPLFLPGYLNFLQKKRKKKVQFCFPRVPSPHPKWFVNKEERMVLDFWFFWLSQRLWLEVGLTWEWKELFFWWVILCVSHCCLKLPALSCPFPVGHVYWGGLPTPACPLCDAVICISLLMVVLSACRMGWAELLGCWGTGGALGAWTLWGTCCGAGCVCWVPWVGSISFQPLELPFHSK